MKCVSCRSLTSNEQCSNTALPSLQFCGKHVKCRYPRIWTEVNNVIPKVVEIQRIWRGYFLRKRLEYAGAGVLKRSLCQNDDELISFDSKLSYDPLNYFSFEENGKIWWFSIPTIATIVFNTMNPMNPYTRQPISIETRRRLRILCRMNKISPLKNYLPTSIWTQVCQVLEENGFQSINPVLFQYHTRTKFNVFMNLLKNDVDALYTEYPKNLDYVRLSSQIRLFMKKQTPFIGTTDASVKVGVLLYLMLSKMKNPYPLCFAIMSAHTRL